MQYRCIRDANRNYTGRRATFNLYWADKSTSCPYLHVENVLIIF